MTTETLDISYARKHLSDLDDRLKEAKIIKITRHSRDAFAVVDIAYLEAVMETLEVLANPEAMQMLADSIDDVREGRLFDQEDVERELL